MKKVSVMNESTYRNKSKQTNGETYSGFGLVGEGGSEERLNFSKISNVM